jgi:hypothetical protein
MNYLEKKLAKHNIKLADFEATMNRVAVTAIENNLTHDFDAAFQLMLKKDAEFLAKFGSDKDFKNKVTNDMAKILHKNLNTKKAA